MFEGSLWSQSVPIAARYLDVSGGQGGGLRGPLPPELGRLKECTFLGVQRQYLEGLIPYLKSSLDVLALQANELKSFPGAHLSPKEAAKVFLFSNHLSCHLPKCSNDVVVSMSLIALGNQLLPECTAVAAIRLRIRMRMRMRILKRTINSGKPKWGQGGGGFGSDPVRVGPPWKRSLGYCEMSWAYILVNDAFLSGIMFGSLS